MKHKHAGFTLIEVLLIVTIIAAMSAIGVAYLQRQAQVNHIEKTSLQIQLWAQASLKYYQDKSTWPTITNSDNIPAEFIAYAPTLSATANPWGYHYQFAARNGTEFLITTTAANSQTASHVAHRLPNSQANGVTVTTTLKPPNIQQIHVPRSWDQRLMVQSITVSNAALPTRLSTPMCADNKTARLFTTQSSRITPVTGLFLQPYTRVENQLIRVIQQQQSSAGLLQLNYCQ